jgi:hypothetical protein
MKQEEVAIEDSNRRGGSGKSPSVETWRWESFANQTDLRERNRSEGDLWGSFARGGGTFSRDTWPKRRCSDWWCEGAPSPRSSDWCEFRSVGMKTLEESQQRAIAEPPGYRRWAERERVPDHSQRCAEHLPPSGKIHGREPDYVVSRRCGYAHNGIAAACRKPRRGSGRAPWISDWVGSVDVRLPDHRSGHPRLLYRGGRETRDDLRRPPYEQSNPPGVSDGWSANRFRVASFAERRSLCSR